MDYDGYYDLGLPLFGWKPPNGDFLPGEMTRDPWVMWSKTTRKTIPQITRNYGWFGDHSQTWMVYGIVLTTLISWLVVWLPFF